MPRGGPVLVAAAAATALLLISRGGKDMSQILPGPPDTGNGSTSPARSRVVAIAEAEEGQQDPARYWREVLPTHQQLGGYPKHWCGGFALWCLRQAGLAKSLDWQIGKGFLFNLPITRTPQPGDVAYIDKPFQHHAIVASVYDNQVTTVDGNQTGNTVAIRTRPRTAITHFFSIDPLLSELERA